MRRADERGVWGAVAALATAAAAMFGLALTGAAQDLLGGRDVSTATSLEVGMDRPGADLFARSLPGGDVADCQQLCRQTDGCAAFTFDRVDGLQAPVCRIKDAAPPPQPAPCCISGVVGAVPAAPMPPVTAPPPPPAPAVVQTGAPPVALPIPPQPPMTAPPRRVTRPAFGGSTLPDIAALRDGFGRCLDLGADGLVRAAQCTGSPSQRAALDAGVLTIGGRAVGPAAPPGACASWQAMSAVRRYALQICRAPEGPSAMSLGWRAGVLAIDATASASPTAITPGAALVAEPAAEPVLVESTALKGYLRLVGRDLCLTTPPDDVSPGAPVYVDFCTAPIATIDGARAAPDARLRFTALPR